MAANRASLRITDLYRARVVAIRERAQGTAEHIWQTVNLADLEGSFAGWHDQAVRLVTDSQQEALRATAGYLTAFLSSEMGTRVSPISIDTKAYIGKAPDGRSLADAFASPLIGIKAELKKVYRARAKRTTVTPEMAAELLGGGTHGHLEAAKVDELAAVIRAGKFVANQGRILITKQGFVFDGQHRLEAVVQTGISTQMLVAEDLTDPMLTGHDRAIRAVGFDLDQASRKAMLDAIHGDDRFDGWRRAIRGTCGACAAVATQVNHGLRFPVHPGCQCVSEPNVRGAANTFVRLTGPQIFAAKTPQEQDQALGPEAAQRYRDGLPLSAFVGHSPMDSDQPDLLTQKPLDAVH